MLVVKVSGLPRANAARIAISKARSKTGARILLRSRSLSLPPGVYTVNAAAVDTPRGSYRPAPARQIVRVIRGRRRSVLVTYAPAPTNPSVDPTTGAVDGGAGAVPPTVKPPEPVVSITFDDGLRSQYTNAIPLLDRYGFTSTQYIPTAGVGDPGRVTVDMIRSMYAGGHQIAAHTVTHPHLTTLSPERLQSELTESRQTLEAIIGAPVLDFASPYGDYNADVLAAIGRVFRTHRTASSGDNTTSPFNRSYIRTQTVQRTTTVADVQQWIDAAKQGHKWLVIAYHQVVATPTDAYGTTPETLDAQLAAIRDSGLRVATVDAVVSEIDAQGGSAKP